ncbi:MAG: hypothetical protein ACC644_03175 [Candidatus Hydrothermarchaeales archaeon]
MKIKIEISDGKTKTNLLIEGEDHFTAKQKIDHFIDFAYNAPKTTVTSKFTPEILPGWLMEYDMKNLSQKEKLSILLEREHIGEWVRSQDLKEEYEQIWGGEIKLSSVSTYLSRFYEEGRIERQGSRAQREYKFTEEIHV